MKKWKEISETNGIYFANRKGEIKSNDRYVTYSDGRVHFHEGKILTPTLRRNYFRTGICINGILRTKATHRLIAQTFIPNPYNLPCVCHKNDIKTDNRVKNLFWGTHKDNTQDMIRKGRKSISMRKLTDEQVKEIRLLLSNGISDYFIGKKLNILRQGVYTIRKGITYKAIA